MAISTQQFAEIPQIQERRLHPRILPKSLIYVACGEANGGMVLNASDDGLAISMAIPVGNEAFSSLNVCMKGLPYTIESSGRMVWTTKSRKRAGIQLIDVSENKRQQIREWLGLEGVREVNLTARVVEEAASQTPVAMAGAMSPMAFPESRSTLLDGFGGSAPESLGPVESELSLQNAIVQDAEADQRFDDLNSNGFRESEWDLAAVTMVPRKKPKPEGLSAFALTLLWIAIPSFGIGILVGRRPLEQWLAGGDAVGKSISRIANRGSEVLKRDAAYHGAIQGDGHPTIGTDAKPLEALPVSPSNNSLNPNVSASTKSVIDSTANAYQSDPAEKKLFNSMSTQEARALAHVSHIDVPEKVNSVAASRTGSTIAGQRNDAGRTARTGPAPVVSDVSNRNWESRDSGLGKNGTPPKNVNPTAPPPAAAPSTPLVAKNVPEQPSANQVSRTISIDSGTNASAAKTVNPSTTMFTNSNSTAPSGVGIAKIPSSSTTSVAPPANATADASVAPVSSESSAGGSSLPRLAAPVPAATDSKSHMIADKRQPPAAFVKSSPSTSSSPLVSNGGPSNAELSKVVPSLSARSVAAGGASSLAPIQAQPPLRGTMLVARKSNETFLLKLPVESVPADGGTSIRMQRSVMVPKQSRWHRHGPIAKLTIGDLLSPVEPDRPDAGVKAREGDTITVRAFIDKNGSVEDLKPISGRFALMPRVMRAVREWQFDQTLLDGKPVESEINVTIEFRPQN